MKVLANEKFRVLAETKGWNLARAEGYVDGETARRRGKPASQYALVGIDDYCLGFRAGYFERQSSRAALQDQQRGSGQSMSL